MKKKEKNKLLWIGIIIAVVILGGILYLKKNTPGQLDDFARCLDESGVTFYGAFWCPHCQEQKEMFGNSERLLPYVECSTANGQGTTITCQQEKITSYPTWEFADGSRQTGVLSLQALAEKSGCELN